MLVQYREIWLFLVHNSFLKFELPARRHFEMWRVLAAVPIHSYWICQEGGLALQPIHNTFTSRHVTHGDARDVQTDSSISCWAVEDPLKVSAAGTETITQGISLRVYKTSNRFEKDCKNAY